MTAPPAPSTHRLLLALAGRVDDDLLAAARELVAIGEEPQALEILVATLVADRTALPAALRAEVVEMARSRAVELDAEGGLAPASGSLDGTPHRFGPEGSEELFATLQAVGGPVGSTVRLTWRLTPAGAAPGPVPHPVVLVELGEGPVAPEVVSYRLGAHLARSGMPASVEAYTRSDALPAYQQAALQAARPIGAERPRPRPRPVGAPDAMVQPGLPETTVPAGLPDTTVPSGLPVATGSPGLPVAAGPSGQPVPAGQDPAPGAALDLPSAGPAPAVGQANGSPGAARPTPPSRPARGGATPLVGPAGALGHAAGGLHGGATDPAPGAAHDQARGDASDSAHDGAHGPAQGNAPDAARGGAHDPAPEPAHDPARGDAFDPAHGGAHDSAHDPARGDSHGATGARHGGAPAPAVAGASDPARGGVAAGPGHAPEPGGLPARAGVSEGPLGPEDAPEAGRPRGPEPVGPLDRVPRADPAPHAGDPVGAETPGRADLPRGPQAGDEDAPAPEESRAHANGSGRPNGASPLASEDPWPAPADHAREERGLSARPGNGVPPSPFPVLGRIELPRDDRPAPGPTDDQRTTPFGRPRPPEPGRRPGPPLSMVPPVPGQETRIGPRPAPVTRPTPVVPPMTPSRPWATEEPAHDPLNGPLSEPLLDARLDRAATGPLPTHEASDPPGSDDPPAGSHAADTPTVGASDDRATTDVDGPAPDDPAPRETTLDEPAEHGASDPAPTSRHSAPTSSEVTGDEADTLAVPPVAGPHDREDTAPPDPVATDVRAEDTPPAGRGSAHAAPDEPGPTSSTGGHRSAASDGIGDARRSEWVHDWTSGAWAMPSRRAEDGSGSTDEPVDGQVTTAEAPEPTTPESTDSPPTNGVPTLRSLPGGRRRRRYRPDDEDPGSAEPDPWGFAAGGSGSESPAEPGDSHSELPPPRPVPRTIPRIRPAASRGPSGLFGPGEVPPASADGPFGVRPASSTDDPPSGTDDPPDDAPGDGIDLSAASPGRSGVGPSHPMDSTADSAAEPTGDRSDEPARGPIDRFGGPTDGTGPRPFSGSSDHRTDEPGRRTGPSPEALASLSTREQEMLRLLQQELAVREGSGRQERRDGPPDLAG